MGRIEEWFKKAVVDEALNPSFPPNLILGIMGIYYMLKWNIKE